MNSENGVPEPNYTQTPNYIFELMPLMGEAELRITFAIIRKTFGWHKDRDMLSLTQLEKLTGLSRQGVIDGTEQGIKRGTVERTPHGQSFDYSIVVKPVDQPETSQASRPELVKPVDRKPVKLVKTVDTQKKGIKERKESVGAKNAPLTDKEKGFSCSQNIIPTATPEHYAAIAAAVKASGAGLRPEVASPREAERVFVRRFEPMITAIFPSRGKISDDTQATKRIYRLRVDEEWLAERLTAYTNGAGDEFRHPSKDGQEPNSFWVWKRIEKEWSIYRKEKADAEQREREQADYDRRCAAALASVSQGEQDRGRSHADSVHLLDTVRGPAGNAVCDAAGQAGIAVDAGGELRVRGDGLGVLPVPQPPVGAMDGPGETPEQGRSVREMFRDYKQRRHLATLDAEIPQRERASTERASGPAAGPRHGGGATGAASAGTASGNGATL